MHFSRLGVQNIMCLHKVAHKTNIASLSVLLVVVDYASSFCIIFHGAMKTMATNLFNWNWNFSMKIGIARNAREGEYQNGSSSSRDISYLIKADCVQLLIGLKLYDHDGGNWNKLLGALSRAEEGDLRWCSEPRVCLFSHVRSLKEACIAK